MKNLLFVILALGVSVCNATEEKTNRKPNQVVEKNVLTFDTENDIKVHHKIWEAMVNAKSKSKCDPSPCDEDSGQLIEGKVACFMGKQGYWCKFRK